MKNFLIIQMFNLNIIIYFSHDLDKAIQTTPIIPKVK